MLTLGSLFDGSGGFPLAAKQVGINPLWASEIEPLPIRVTRSRLPEVRHLGDIREIDGAAIPPVDVITFGSPCTDLSIAGKREGITGKQSSLFFEAVRVITEMRTYTGCFPQAAVWENVTGALSSNQGRDFQAVLNALIRIGNQEAPDVPTPRRWPMQEASWQKASLSRGGYSMHNISARPNAAAEFSWSHILEDTPPRKQYLSQRACRGIISRLTSRPQLRPFPQELMRALTRQADLPTL